MTLRLLGVALLMLAGCTLLTQFNPEGQPCDGSADPAEQCLSGFHCEGGKCVHGAYDAGVPSADGG
jgi:hypothetical protein